MAIYHQYLQLNLQLTIQFTIYLNIKSRWCKCYGLRWSLKRCVFRGRERVCSSGRDGKRIPRRLIGIVIKGIPVYVLGNKHVRLNLSLALENVIPSAFILPPLMDEMFPMPSERTVSWAN